MIQEFVDQFMAKKDELRAKFAAKYPENYQELVRHVIELFAEEDNESPDPTRIHQIDDGDYQGTLLFVIGSNAYQPDRYWFVKVAYGSCSGCDTLEAINDKRRGSPTSEEIDQYMTLALHVAQRLKLLDGDIV